MTTDEHVEVIITGIGGSLARSMGDLPGVRNKVELVKGKSFEIAFIGQNS
jgi:small subunit ribosomal protein S12